MLEGRGGEETVPVTPCHNGHMNRHLVPIHRTLHLGTRLSNLKTRQTGSFLAGKKIQSSSFPAEEDNMWEEEGRKELSLENNPFMLWRAGSQG